MSRGLLFADGFFPFLIKRKDFHGDDFVEFDGVTLYREGSTGMCYPSSSSSELLEVYGGSSNRPIGLTKEQLGDMYLRARGYTPSTLNPGSSVVSVSGATASGGHYEGEEWVPDSASSEGQSVSVEDAFADDGDLAAGERGWLTDSAGVLEKAESRYTLVPTITDIGSDSISSTFPVKDRSCWLLVDGESEKGGSETNGGATATAQCGAIFKASNSSFGFPISAAPFIFEDTIFANDLYWPAIDQWTLSCFVSRFISETTQSGPAPGTVTNTSDSGSGNFQGSTYFVAESEGDEALAVLSSNAIPVEVWLFGQKYIEFSMSLWAYNFLNDSIVGTPPNMKFTAISYWTYGGIYDETTGVKV